ncbi:MAG TPA: MFS transporter [Stellaceae bacterium]|jgi:predicted MFS family arabinose efflux permease
MPRSVPTDTTRDRRPDLPPPPSSAPPASSTLAPLRHPLFRAVWLTNLVSNFGTWMQSVGAAWLMTAIAPSPDMVALVQASASLPILLFSLVAGALADLHDRRRLLLLAQSWMLAIAALLALVTWLGWITPWLLLALTFALGVGSALNGPAWQASVGEFVPRAELAPAITLNSVGFNIARAVGPALGGVIVAAAGAEIAFLLNALSYIGLIVVLARWKRAVDAAPQRKRGRQRLGQALIEGARYAAETPPVRALLVRALAFGVGAGAIWALLPLVAKQDLGGGPFMYGVLLGALGIGAVAGAFAIGRLRTLLSAEAVVSTGTLSFALATLALGAAGGLVPVALAALLVAGAAWLGTLSSFNVAVQTTAPGWVMGRALAVYQMTAFGGLAFGSWLWGGIATAMSVHAALLIAGALMVLSLALRRSHPIAPEPAA